MKKAEFVDLLKMEVERFESSWKDNSTVLQELEEGEWWEKFFDFMAEANQEAN